MSDGPPRRPPGPPPGGPPGAPPGRPPRKKLLSLKKLNLLFLTFL